MAWIKAESSLTSKPEIFAMAAELGLNQFDVAGRCLAFWAWADAVSVDGDLPLVTPHAVDAVTHREGFAEALLHVGWLTATPTGLRIPNFDLHNGESAKKRAIAQKRMARLRTRDASSATDVALDAQQDANEKRNQRRGEESQRRVDKKDSRNPIPIPAALGTLSDSDSRKHQHLAIIRLAEAMRIPSAEGLESPLRRQARADLTTLRVIVARVILDHEDAEQLIRLARAPDIQGRAKPMPAFVARCKEQWPDRLDGAFRRNGRHQPQPTS